MRYSSQQKTVQRQRNHFRIPRVGFTMMRTNVLALQGYVCDTRRAVVGPVDCDYGLTLVEHSAYRLMAVLACGSLPVAYAKE
jgi:hypothetical protein